MPVPRYQKLWVSLPAPFSVLKSHVSHAGFEQHAWEHSLAVIAAGYASRSAHACWCISIGNVQLLSRSPCADSRTYVVNNILNATVHTFLKQIVTTNIAHVCPQVARTKLRSCTDCFDVRIGGICCIRTVTHCFFSLCDRIIIIS